MENKRIRVAVAKGRILEEVCDLLSASGYPTNTINKKTRQLIFEIKDLTILACKPADVTKYVDLGAADCGIVGSDCIMETNYEIYEPLTLSIGKCKMVLACLKNKKLVLTPGMDLKIGTKYPKITKAFFAKKKIFPEIVYLNGSVELAPAVGLCDAIVDITETGSTIKENNLKVVDSLHDICAKLVMNRASYRIYSQELKELALALSNKNKK